MKTKVEVSFETRQVDKDRVDKILSIGILAYMQTMAAQFIATMGECPPGARRRFR